MGFEYRIETRECSAENLDSTLRRLPHFSGQEGNRYYFDLTSKAATAWHDFQVHIEADHLYVLHPVREEFSRMLLGFLVERLCSLNGSVVVSEL